MDVLNLEDCIVNLPQTEQSQRELRGKRYRQSELKDLRMLYINNYHLFMESYYNTMFKESDEPVTHLRLREQEAYLHEDESIYYARYTLEGCNVKGDILKQLEIDGLYLTEDELQGYRQQQHLSEINTQTLLNYNKLFKKGIGYYLSGLRTHLTFGQFKDQFNLYEQGIFATNNQVERTLNNLTHIRGTHRTKLYREVLIRCGREGVDKYWRFDDREDFSDKRGKVKQSLNQLAGHYNLYGFDDDFDTQVEIMYIGNKGVRYFYG